MRRVHLPPTRPACCAARTETRASWAPRSGSPGGRDTTRASLAQKRPALGSDGTSPKCRGQPAPAGPAGFAPAGCPQGWGAGATTLTPLVARTGPRLVPAWPLSCPPWRWDQTPCTRMILPVSPVTALPPAGSVLRGKDRAVCLSSSSVLPVVDFQ